MDESQTWLIYREKCSVSDMNSYKIRAVGVKIKPKDYITLYTKCPYLYTDRNQI